MKKTYKRLSALILAICLALSGVMPAVWAEEVTTMTYDFDVFNTTLSDGTKLTGGNSLVYNTAASNTTLYEKLDTAYKNNAINWYFNAESKYAFEHAYGATAAMSTEYTQIRMMAGGYISFTIRNPGEGEWKVSVKYPKSNQGAKAAVYILDDNNTKYALGEYDCLDASLTGSGTVIGTEKFSTDLTNWTAGTDATYTLVLESVNGAKNSNAVVLISEIILTKVETEAKNVAQVGDNKFTDLQSAITAAAAAKSTAVLLDDVTVDGTLTVSANATLDLAGYTLTAASVSADFDGANIVDRSAKDTGVLKVTGEMKLDEANGELPLYDSAKGGYRFFEATVTSLGKTGAEQNKFWFRVSFTNSDAYALAASQMDIGAGLTADEITQVTEAWAGTTFTGTWVTAVNGGTASDICFTAKNFSSLTNFKLTPVVKANGVTVSGAAL